MIWLVEFCVLQFCYGYDGFFFDCVCQYVSLFVGILYKVIMVFFIGCFDFEVVVCCVFDEVLFFEYGFRDICGFKLKVICDLCEIVCLCDFCFCIVYCFKLIWIVSLVICLLIVGVYYVFGDYQWLLCKVFVGLMSKCLSLLVVFDVVCDDICCCLLKWLVEWIEMFYNCIDVVVLQVEQVECLSVCW